MALLVRAVLVASLLLVACKGDDTVVPAPPPQACTCEANENCKACCNECAAKSCDELRAGHDCPLDATAQ